MDTEFGSIFKPPTGFPWTDFGAYIGVGGGDTQLAPEALKGHYSHFNHFGPMDAKIGFPYTLLRQYDAELVAAGQPSMFVTATYEGKKRPVMFNTYLALDSEGKPTSPKSKWVYAVNTRDDRFIKFWITQYARPMVLQPMTGLRNVWVYIDGCAFTYSAYGVLDNSGRFVGGIPWDAPAAQNAEEYLSNVAYFFNRVKQLAPDIKFITDVGSMSDPSQFQTIYQNIPAALAEDTIAWFTNPVPSMRMNFYNQIFPWFSWLGSTGRIGLMGAQLPSNWQPQVQLLTGFILYELVKGQNFFFAPRDQDVNPGIWEAWNSALGSPVGLYRQGSAHSQDSDRLFSRQYSTGWVYLNWTGSTQTVTLPTGNWVDPNNHRVTKITIPNLRGTFVSTARTYAATAQPPSISPRTEQTMTGPVPVTIISRTSNATIHYTLDGSTPTSSSPVYSGPLHLHSSAVVTARAFASGYNPSPISADSLTVRAGAPEVQFSTTSDSVPASGSASVSTYYPVFSLTGVPDQTVTVTYTVLSPQGSLSTHSVSFVPGEIYRQFPVSLSGKGTWTIAIVSATGAIPGSLKAFTLTRK